MNYIPHLRPLTPFSFSSYRECYLHFLLVTIVMFIIGKLTVQGIYQRNAKLRTVQVKVHTGEFISNCFPIIF
jgi:hypothetical protein